MAYLTIDEQLRRSAYKRPWMRNYKDPFSARKDDNTNWRGWTEPGRWGGQSQSMLSLDQFPGQSAAERAAPRNAFNQINSSAALSGPFQSTYTPGVGYKSFEEALAVGKEARDNQDLEDYRRYAGSFGVPATAQGFDSYRKEKHGERQQEVSAAQKNAAIARQQANQNREFALNVWKAKQANFAAAQSRQIQMAKARAQQSRYSGGTPTGRGGGGGYGGGSRSVSSTNLPINRARKNAESGVYAGQSDNWIRRNVARLGGDAIDANYMIRVNQAHMTSEGRSAFTAGQQVVTARNTGEKKQVDAFEGILQSGRIDQLNRLDVNLISDNNRRILHSKLENYLHTQQDPNFYDNMEDAWKRAKADYDKEPTAYETNTDANPLKIWQDQYEDYHSSDKTAVEAGAKPSFYKKPTAFDIEKHPAGARYDVYDYSPFSELFPRPVGPGFDPITSGSGSPLDLPPAQPAFTTAGEPVYEINADGERVIVGWQNADGTPIENPLDPDWEEGVDSPFGGTGPNLQTSPWSPPPTPSASTPWGPDSPDDSSPMWQTPAAADADIASMQWEQRWRQEHPNWPESFDPTLHQWEKNKELRAAGQPTGAGLSEWTPSWLEGRESTDERLRMEDVQRRFMAGNVTPEERADLEQQANLWRWKKDAGEGLTTSTPATKAPVISIQEAAKEGNIRAVKQHIAAGTDVNERGHRGETAMYWAAKNNHKEVVTLLSFKGRGERERLIEQGRSRTTLGPTGTAIDELNRIEERGEYATQLPLEHVGKNTMFVDPNSITDFGSRVEGQGVKEPWYGRMGTMPGEVASLAPEMVNAMGQLINTLPTGELWGMGKEKTGVYYDAEGIPILRDMPVIGGMFGHGDYMTGPLPTERQEEVRIPVLDNPAQYMESGLPPNISPGEAEKLVEQYFQRHVKAREAKGELEMADKAQMWQSAWSDLQKNYNVPAREFIGRTGGEPLPALPVEKEPYTGGVPRTERGQYLFDQGYSQESLAPPHKPRGGWPLRGGTIPPSPEDRELAEIQRRFMVGGTTPEERADLKEQAYAYYKKKYAYLTDEELNKLLSEPNTWWPESP